MFIFGWYFILKLLSADTMTSRYYRTILHNMWCHSAKQSSHCARQRWNYSPCPVTLGWKTMFGQRAHKEYSKLWTIPLWHAHFSGKTLWPHCLTPVMWWVYKGNLSHECGEQEKPGELYFSPKQEQKIHQSLEWGHLFCCCRKYTFVLLFWW